MANTPQDDRFYKSKTLLKVFGISSIVMLVFTLWMILDDFGRPWKAYQLEFFKLKKDKYEKNITAAQQAIDPAALKQAQDAEVQGKKDLEARKSEVAKAEKELDKLKTTEKIATGKYQDAKAAWDVEKYHFESEYGHEVAHGKEKITDPQIQAKLAYLEKGWQKVLALRDRSNEAQQAINDKQRDLDSLTAEKDKADKAWKTLNADVDRLKGLEDSSTITLMKLARNAPILDLASPVLKINQIVVPSYKTDIYFAQVQAVNRCTTCHLAIDTPGFENEKEPFRTHPKLDVMLGSRSPHPIDTIGCTPCHAGRGESVDFVRAAHTPHSEEQQKEWVKKYGWTEQHYVTEKMIPLQFTEGKCKSCHRQTEYIPKAEKQTAAVQLIRGAGCYACHKIAGWEDVRKPAPSLKKVKSKLTRDWIVKWVSNPQAFNDHSRMPAIFHQSNITTKEFGEFQDAEINAITDYVLNISEEYTPTVKLPLGNAERGKALFGSVGCLGCHGIDDYQRVRYGMAPDLTTVGSKVTKEWIVDWIRYPRHYMESTTMPDLRLSDQEASDIAAYLLSKKNPDFDVAKPVATDIETQKKVLRMYLMRDPKLAPNTDEKIDKVLSGLSAHDVTMKLGENAMNRYGCFTCHEIKGYEKTPGIGTELTEEGSKPLNKFDFGLVEMERTNYGFMETKLLNPRVYDSGTVKEYLDLLRMPNFHFEQPEAQTIVTALIGYTSQKVDAPLAKVLNPHEAKQEIGMRVIHKYNCQGCHVVERLWTPTADDDPTREEHEKSKYLLEGRILKYYQDDETLGPPVIYGEGKKVFTSWAFNFISNPYPLRTRLKIRMPTFHMSTEELNHIITGWGNQGENIEFPISLPQKVNMTPQQKATAQTLFNRLQCLNCHSLSEKAVAADNEGSRGLAPSFAWTARRLRRDWIVEWLKDPQKLQPGTRMPGFWPDGNSPAPDILGGNSQAQIELLADYLISLGQNAHEDAKKVAE